jgi:hypothetical protein
MGYNKDVQLSNQQLKVRPFGEPPSLKPSPLPAPLPNFKLPDFYYGPFKPPDFKLPDFYYRPFKPPDFTYEGHENPLRDAQAKALIIAKDFLKEKNVNAGYRRRKSRRNNRKSTRRRRRRKD